VTILNRHTEVPIERTAGQIQARLVRARAQAVMMEYEAGVLTHLAFRIETPHGLIAYRLPANIDGVHAMLTRDTKLSRAQRSREAAARVAWRVLRSWIEAQLAVIDAGQATLPQVFLPYAQLPSGETLYERFAEKGLPMLTHDA
jgi:hypothetical protein